MTFKQIYETIWKDHYLEDKSIIFYHIGQLRRLLGSGWIENVHGVGYRLCDRTEKYKELDDKTKKDLELPRCHIRFVLYT